jgi:hypothetical protein
MPDFCDVRIRILVAGIAGLALVSACGESSRSKEPVTLHTVPPQLLVDKWLGVWNGPEGTSLELSKQHDRLHITIRNLDGPRTFNAIADDSSITFMRDDLQETVRAGSGADTGMKWLAEKTDCLVIKYGEGYCRE